ncbi:MULTISPECIES: phytanoyl-CoA dioxygenase family protein [unclassified Pseudomonas]|uniref:phytanoyl-CoA dioxygenase family protein n=1 Tax=unclassified Pseudomonas TaxID=196821 RepID=UPI000482D253|nr:MULTISPECIES: phytanoyl-CoA dioxygenase family protein [unclassified Pseudomonas]RAS22439.1 phytanoyl-CoA dioxygenase PhyH [Pseudomonas sp. URMO17WK12:I7]SMF01352.1 Protein involved in biosynthesis of mitomycin antibiotics/polyketide fumonisin [Pseudomonas sp. URMO17WK12:I5]
MSLDPQLQTLQEQGYLLLRGVLDGLRVALLRGAIDDLQPLHWDYQGLLEHYKCVFNRDPLWLPFLDLSPLIDLAEAALGADCHVIGQTAWRSHPGYPGMGLHLDHLPMVLPEWLVTRGDFCQPMQILTAQVYLSDIDVDIGPTWVVPGSHRAARPPQPGECHWQGREARPVLCQAGDALLFRSDLWHSGGANCSQGRERDMLQVHYGRRMVAQKFSPYLRWQFNPQVLAQATPRQRRLLGEHEEAEYD